ncbi:MAG TPA: outer membrane protein transport protein [Kofleriaceae bacterium]|nr:outer membrane protein transport protein [Kofleriaceae bacterium]
MKIAIALVLAAPAAHAGGLEVAEQNAVSAATGGAGAAREDDPGAAWHDPAALADDGGWRVGLSVVAARPSIESSSAQGTTTSAPSWSTPPHLDASFAQGRWAAGVAVGVPFGGGVTWPAMWPGASQAVQTQLQDVRVAPFAAWSFGALRVAAGMHVDFGRLDLDRGLDFVDTTGDVRMSLSGIGIGADASAFYKPRADLGIALAYRSRTSISFSGPAAFTAPDAFADETPDQQAYTHMTMPDQLVLGARWQRGALAVLGDLAYTRWSEDPATTITFADAQTPSAVQTNDWHDTFAARAGAEWRAGKLVARAGAYYDPTPVPAEHLVPAAPDGDRLGLTVGASWRLAAAWSADAFAERMWILARATTSVDTMPATYGGSAVVLGAGVRWTR